MISIGKKILRLCIKKEDCRSDIKQKICHQLLNKKIDQLPLQMEKDWEFFSPLDKYITG
jgi:hypothetical protein